MEKNDLLMSIVIPAHNEEKYLEKTLKSTKKQSYKNIEVIVVDDGSIDKTAQIAKGYTKKVVRLKKKKGVSYARNAGARLAKGEVVLFLDADTLLGEKDTIKKIVEHVKEGSVYGTCRMKAEKPRGFLYVFFKNLFVEYTPLRACNGIIFVKRDIHEEIGGFNEKRDKEEVFEYFEKARVYGKFGFVNSAVIPSMRRGCMNTIAYWVGIKVGLLRNKPYPVTR